MADTRLSTAEKERLIARANRRCEYCKSPMDFCPDPFSVEHILPKARGGSDDNDNTALSCQGCNNKKHTKTTGLDPISRQRVPLFHPRQDDWNTHFRWSDDLLAVIGITPTGRATVSTLQLNRAGVVNLRRILKVSGEHPVQILT
jgi:hypothetical protein